MILWLAVSATLGGPTGGTFFVSKLGRNTDGASWATAFTTIQAALDAVPPGGGHRILVRPDTYFEANLAPAHPGVAGRYCELVADVDGRLGSGTAGWVVIDSGDPGQRGFKSYDWWGPIRATSRGWSPEHNEPTFSALGWDRWRLAGLYVTGGDAGLFFDGTDRVEPFSVLVEDCVSLGRAFGGGVASVLSRPDEPITFRRCSLWALDTWGDTAAAYVRVENPAPPERPDAVFEECTLVSPECALKSSNYGFHTFSRVALERCRLVVLNFSQPAGQPSRGIIQSVQEGKLLHVDLADCSLMGYRVFGVVVQPETVGELTYTTRGNVRAYVQFQQAVPAGMHRLPDWPVELFEGLTPPSPRRPSPFVDRELVVRDRCELTPLVWRGRRIDLHCVRPAAGGERGDYYLSFRDAATGEEVGRCAEGYGLASALVVDDTLHAFASRWSPDGWQDVTVFWSRDLRTWESRLALAGDHEGIFNTSVCRGPDDFVMAYESSDPAYPAFTVKFARSTDLLNWTRLPEATFGCDRYTACPCLRYADGYWYVLYLEHRAPRHRYETYLTRSANLRDWELSSANPVLRAEGLDEGINASDPELIELDGRTWLYFAVGDQLTWMNLKRTGYPGPLNEFLASWYRQPGVPDWGSAAFAGEAVR